MRFCILDSSLFLTLTQEDATKLRSGAACSLISPNNYVYFIAVKHDDEVTLPIPVGFKHDDDGVLRDIDVIVGIPPSELEGLFTGGIISVNIEASKRIHITLEEFFDAFVEKNNIPVKQVMDTISSITIN